MSAGITRAPRRPGGWVASGPPPAGARGRPELEPADGEDLCLLSGDWRIFQRLRGHRWSLDDLVTAWRASRGPAPRTALDLGSGIGSVLMMIAWSFPRARCVGVEAQELSRSMALRSLAWNGADDRCEVRLGDLRDASLFADGERFDLVTGTPPYFPRGEGVESDQPQKGPCRFEHRGGVEAYALAAAARLAEGARFVMCAAAGEEERVFAGAEAARLRVHAALEVVPREGKPPRVAVFTLAREAPPSDPARERLVVRDRAGAWTAEFADVRRAMGMPVAPR
jgi:tRNA1(Val) A37 N6-methylase TrmN6